MEKLIDNGNTLRSSQCNQTRWFAGRDPWLHYLQLLLRHRMTRHRHQVHVETHTLPPRFAAFRAFCTFYSAKSNCEIKLWSIDSDEHDVAGRIVGDDIGAILPSGGIRIGGEGRNVTVAIAKEGDGITRIRRSGGRDQKGRGGREKYWVCFFFLFFRKGDLT